MSLAPTAASELPYWSPFALVAGALFGFVLGMLLMGMIALVLQRWAHSRHAAGPRTFTVTTELRGDPERAYVPIEEVRHG